MRYMRHPQHGIMPVEDGSQDAIRQRAGWEYFDMPTKSVPAPVAVPVPVTAPEPADDHSQTDAAEFEALRAKAHAQGIQIDGRWGLARLRIAVNGPVTRR